MTLLPSRDAARIAMNAARAAAERVGFLEAMKSTLPQQRPALGSDYIDTTPVRIR